MERKPEIQYVGQFYVYGSEARQLEEQSEQKKRKIRLPLLKAEKLYQIQVDPVAICAILTAAVMLVVMVLGTIRMQQAWQQFGAVQEYRNQLKQTNIQLTTQYRESIDLESVRQAALAMGMVEMDQVETRYITVKIPQREKDPTWWENLCWFWQGLFGDLPESPADSFGASFA